MMQGDGRIFVKFIEMLKARDIENHAAQRTQQNDAGNDPEDADLPYYYSGEE